MKQIILKKIDAARITSISASISGENIVHGPKVKTESESSADDTPAQSSGSWRPPRSSSGSLRDDEDEEDHEDDDDESVRRSPEGERAMAPRAAAPRSETDSSGSPSSSARRSPSPTLNQASLLSLEGDDDLSAPSTLADLPLGEFSLEETLDLVGLDDAVAVDVSLALLQKPIGKSAHLIKICDLPGVGVYMKVLWTLIPIVPLPLLPDFASQPRFTLEPDNLVGMVWIALQQSNSKTELINKLCLPS